MLYIPIPPLHAALLGPVNQCIKYLEAIEKVGFNAFTKSIHVVKENYQGTTYEGNECHKILKNLELLKDKMMCELEKWDPEGDSDEMVFALDLIEALEAVKIFYTACCGHELKGQWNNSILQFRKVFSGLLQNHGFSIYNKLHIIMDHSEEYITETKTPLGHVNDQLIESAHAHMLQLVKE